MTDDALVIDLIDGRTISAPLAWYPRLLHGNPAERDNWRLVGQGEGIHWPDLDEDISVENVVGQTFWRKPAFIQTLDREPDKLRVRDPTQWLDRSGLPHLIDYRVSRLAV